ncbi:hypothetical protein D3C87_1172560 [compost metagenome]
MLRPMDVVTSSVTSGLQGQELLALSHRTMRPSRSSVWKFGLLRRGRKQSGVARHKIPCDRSNGLSEIVAGLFA